MSIAAVILLNGEKVELPEFQAYSDFDLYIYIYMDYKYSSTCCQILLESEIQLLMDL